MEHGVLYLTMPVFASILEIVFEDQVFEDQGSIRADVTAIIILGNL